MVLLVSDFYQQTFELVSLLDLLSLFRPCPELYIFGLCRSQEGQRIQGKLFCSTCVLKLALAENKPSTPASPTFSYVSFNFAFVSLLPQRLRGS